MNSLINEITEKEFSNQIPIKKLLQNSLYYPACGFDGGVVKHFSKEVQSFVYCDYATGEEKLIKEKNSFYGYDILFERSVAKGELTPKGLVMDKPPGINKDEYLKYSKSFEKPFCHWSIYERSAGFSEDHGPKRFSLLYVGGEGAATYQALYYSNKSTAKMLAIIQPGTGWGLNWTDFRKHNGFLAFVVLKNPHGSPNTIIYGGIGKDYNDLKWPGYVKTGIIKNYYFSKDSFDNGEVTIWQKQKG